MQFLFLLALFSVLYFGLFLPLFQLFSRRLRGRRFVVRLGGPWKVGNPEHRWDVLMSFLSFMLALAAAMYVLDLLFPLSGH